VNFLALDLSIRSTGFAMWKEGMALPVSGTWELASSVDWAARAFVRLHRNLMDLHRVEPIDDIVFEEAIPPFALHGNTNAKTLAAAAGLAAHVESFAEACGIRRRAVNLASWRRHFIGKMPRGTKTPDLKHMAMTRCRELGFDVQKHDAAEACGLLDYQISVAGIIAPWRQGVLERQLLPATDGRAAA
jgi:hypothetical protein